MFSREIGDYAWLNLRSRLVRSSLTLLSIIVGIMTIFIFVSFGLGLFMYVEGFAEELGVDKIILQPRGIGAPGADQSVILSDDDLSTLRKVRGVRLATGMMFSVGRVESNDEIRYHYVAGLPTDDPDERALAQQFLTVDIAEGRALQRGDAGRAVLGHGYTVPNRALERPLRLNDRILVNDIPLRVIGFYEPIGNPVDDANIYVTFDVYQTLFEQEKLQYTMIIGSVDDPDRIDEVIERAERQLRQSRGLERGDEDFFIQSFEDMLQSFRAVLDIIVYFVVFIALISVVISGINTANTMFTSILERTKEIGVLKAIGATNGQIMSIFLIEASLLGFIAGVIGAALGAGLSYMGGLILVELGFGFLQPFISLYTFIGCVLFAVAVGMLSGIIPAYKASQKNPVDSLRYE